MLLKPSQIHHLPDEQLIAAYQKNNDPRIVGILYKRHAHNVLGLCMNYLKNVHDSEDALMEIFEMLTESLKKYQIDHFESWLYFVSKNYCLKKFKNIIRDRPKEFSELSGDLFMENIDEETPLVEDRLEALSEAIDLLKADQRNCITLFFFENMSYKEIEAATAYSLNEVKSHIQNGKRNLRTLMSKVS